MGHEKTCESVGVEEADNGYSTEWNRELPEKAERELRACVEICPCPLGVGGSRGHKAAEQKRDMESNSYFYTHGFGWLSDLIREVSLESHWSLGRWLTQKFTTGPSSGTMCHKWGICITGPTRLRSIAEREAERM